MVACLPLVQQVRGSIPGGVVNFNFKISNLGARRGGDVHNPGLNCKPFRSLHVEKAYTVVLLIAIRPGGPLGAFREEQAMRRHRVSLSPFLLSSSHTTQLHYTNSYTYSHPNLNFLQYTIQILVPHVMWSAQVLRDSKIDYT